MPVQSRADSSARPSRSSSVPEWAESFIEAHQSSGQAGSSSFKLADTEQHVQNSEAEFSSFLDGTDAFTPSAPEPETSHTSTDWFTNPERHRATPKARAPEGPLTVEEQEELDGQEVRDILSSFDPDEQFVPPPEDDLEMNWGLSKDQLIALRSITRELLPIDIPREDSSMPFATNRARIYNTSYRPGETTEAWKGVLNGYTDDVWGSMLPLVRKARVELEQDETDEVQKPRGPTLERLRIILNHLKKYDDIPILLPG